MKSANYAPIYACVYAQLAEVARSHGYALAVHGSLAADFDLVCIPWVSGVSDPQSVVDEIASLFAIEQVTGFERKEHGRIATTISFSFGECRLDLSFMPQISRSARCSAGVERCMVVSIDGTHEAVRASDYDALAAENERMRAQITERSAPQPEQSALIEALKGMLAIHDEPSGFAGKYGRALDEAVAAQKVKIDQRIAAARTALSTQGGQ